MALIGAWHVRSSADCEILSRLARRANPEIEEALARLLTFDDSPVWSVAQHRGVASKMDALFAVSPYITETHLSDFFDLALYVLSESDPALELPEGERWMAGVYGKVRNHSGALRQGVCETLVILAVHGNNLFRDRLGFDFEARVSALIERLLTPLTLDKLLSNDHDLPRYAEAAPDTVLSILEHDLRNPAPVLLGLLKPADSGPFGRCLRTGLLWALEVLAWNPRTLSRVTAILAQLSRTGIDDNWANKPIASLHAIYRCWMPQTAATLPARLQALEALVRKFPDIGWEICIDQFSPHSRMGSYSYRPHWRNDASSAGHVLTRGETDQFARKALDLAVAWPNHDARTLGDLIERLDGMTEQDQEMVWNLASAWAESATDEEAKAVLRERIRRFAFTRRGRGRRLKSATRDRAREIRAKLTPSDPVVRHGWLFAKHWVEESAEEIEDSALDYSKRSERIHEQRRAAMTEIWRDRGLDGAMTLLRASEAPVVIGYYAGLSVTDPAELTNVIVTLLTAPAENDGRSDGFLQGLLQSVDATIRPVLLRRIANSVSPETAARLFRCAPFSEETWRLLDEQTPEVRERYWRDVMPQWNRFSDTELNEVIDKFLEVQRPRVAFHAVHMDWDRIETSRLKRLMTLLPRGNEPEGTFRLDSYEIAEALKELDQRPGVTRDEMAQLEFLYIRALDHSEYGIPNLERQVAESPAVFVQAVALAYKRSDDGQDPPGWSVEDPEQRSAIGLSAHHLLRRIRLIPGTESGVINANVLRDWLIETRRLCAEHARADIGDQHIGQLLAQAPPEPDGSQWPCRAVCEAMEAVASEHIGRGFHVGVYNSRGVVWRGEGGAQERELARKYRTFAQQTAIDFPFVSSVLESIASSYDRDAEREDSEARVSRRLSR